mmetsp:Transcript_36742/g.105892  ORF Transcript_36742/g.105892 Transcript_36742/m.105892 type:complete len:256 (+) Transcript_36742:49-816(+)
MLTAPPRNKAHLNASQCRLLSSPSLVVTDEFVKPFAHHRHVFLFHAVDVKHAVEVVILVLEDAGLVPLNPALEGLAFYVHCLYHDPHRPYHRSFHLREGEAGLEDLIPVVPERGYLRVHEDHLSLAVVRLRRAQAVVDHDAEVHPHLGCSEPNAGRVRLRVHGPEEVLRQLPQLLPELRHLRVGLPEQRVRVLEHGQPPGPGVIVRWRLVVHLPHAEALARCRLWPPQALGSRRASGRPRHPHPTARRQPLQHRG